MQITLYALANYNNGHLIAKTFDLGDYRNHDGYREAVSGWLDTVPYPHEPGRFEEEWIVAGWEAIPDQFVGEYNLYREFWEYFNKRRELCESQHEAFDEFCALVDSGDDSLADFQDKLIGYFETGSDFVYHWFTEVKGLTEFPPREMVIDYEDTRNVIFANNAICEQNGYYFWNC